MAKVSFACLSSTSDDFYEELDEDVEPVTLNGTRGMLEMEQSFLQRHLDNEKRVTARTGPNDHHATVLFQPCRIRPPADVAISSKAADRCPPLRFVIGPSELSYRYCQALPSVTALFLRCQTSQQNPAFNLLYHKQPRESPVLLTIGSLLPLKISAVQEPCRLMDCVIKILPIIR